MCLLTMYRSADGGAVPTCSKGTVHCLYWLCTDLLMVVQVLLVVKERFTVSTDYVQIC